MLPNSSRIITKPTLQKISIQDRTGEVICTDTDVASKNFLSNDVTCESPDLAQKTFSFMKS